MDILSHTLAGMVAGSTLAASFGKNVRQKMLAIVAGATGGALPDIDAISMWSRFDGTLGEWFGLSLSGKEIYTAKLWYSHHGFMHSLMGGILSGIVILLLCFLLTKQKMRSFPFYVQRNQLILYSFLCGFLFHLFGDMITPASAWGGVRLFFPSTIYIGGTGSIWWWNNYDLFLILLVTFTANCLLIVGQQTIRKSFKPWGWLPLLIGFAFFTIQVKTRKYDFNQHTYSKNEQYSKDIQQKILSPSMYQRFVRFDNSLKIHF